MSSPPAARKSSPPAVTVKDVAAQAGVSTATVSRVLSGKGGVRKELELRVREAIQSLEYRPNQAARRLRERKSKIIGVLVPDIQIPFFASIVVGIDKVLQQAGYLLLLGNTHDNLADEQLHIQIFLGEDVSGIIFAPANITDLSQYQRLQEMGIPLAAIDRSPGDLRVDTVQVANARAASQAVQHLIQEGHQRIALITGPDSISTAVERQQGYEQALRLAGLPCEVDWIQVGDYTQQGGYRAMLSLMSLELRPTAVLIANNVMTLGALQYIHEQGIEIPCDVALISFDDMPWASALRPPLTVIAQPVNEIGTVAARLMLDRIREPLSSTKHVILETQLIQRASCNCGKRSAE
jgi:DNA-binding LacI/PurR family transcriptional regulator